MEKDILFGICADVHHGSRSDEKWRVKKFVDEATERGADFIIQLGDFTSFSPEGHEVVKIWNEFSGPSYHVLGNHETELSDMRAVLDMLGQKDNYYSFDAGNYHFIVLDTNYAKIGDEYVHYENQRTNFGNCHSPPEQVRWLEADLSATEIRI